MKGCVGGNAFKGEGPAEKVYPRVSVMGNSEVNNNHSPFYISEVVCGNTLLYIAELIGYTYIFIMFE